MTFIEEIIQTNQKKSETMAATITPKILQLRKESIRRSMMVEDEGHRREYFARVADVDFCDDSMACTLNASWFTLESAYRPVVWIMQCGESLSELSELTSLVSRTVRAVVVMGGDVDSVKEIFADVSVASADDMEGAVAVAMEMAKPNDVVMLSPSCSPSYPYSGVADRGDHFKSIVRRLTDGVHS